jgi:hypothetical protein
MAANKIDMKPLIIYISSADSLLAEGAHSSTKYQLHGVCVFASSVKGRNISHYFPEG